MRRLERFALLLLAVGLLAAGPLAPAGAHAVLDTAVPAARSTVRVSPKEITLTFTERLEPAFSIIRVLDAKGKQVDDNNSRIDAADAASLRVSLPPLAAGRYRVSWRVLSIDTHVTKGEFTFDVAP
jgi:methionine-rich copper-binding protein CopC